MPRRIKVAPAPDAAQLREELRARGLGATVEEPNAAGEVYVTVPDETQGAEVDGVLHRHFPRSLLTSIMVVDFEGAGTVAELRARCVELRNRTARALRQAFER